MMLDFRFFPTTGFINSGRLLYAFLATVIFLSGCRQSSTPNRRISDSKNDFTTTQLNLIDFLADTSSHHSMVRTIKFIKLETTEECVLGSVSKILHFDDKYYLLDSKVKRIFLFHESGKFLKTIGKFGRGPGEILEVYDIELDRAKGTVLLLSNNSRAIQVYSADGEYIRTQKFDFNTLRFASFGGEEIAMFSNFSDEPYNIRICKSSGEILKLFPYPENTFPMHFYFSGGLKSTLSGSALYCNATSSKIYEFFSDGTSYLKYDINMGSRAWPDEKKYQFNDFFLSISRFETDFIGSNFLETDKYFYFDYMDVNRFRHAFYNKTTGKIYIRGNNLTEDPLSKLMSGPLGLSEDGWFISIIDPVRFNLTDSERISVGNKYKTFYQFMERNPMEATDNPILVIYEYN